MIWGSMQWLKFRKTYLFIQIIYFLIQNSITYINYNEMFKAEKQQQHRLLHLMDFIVNIVFTVQLFIETLRISIQINK